jgi:hypothetical protein
MAEAELTVSIETVVHAALVDAAQRISDEHDIRVNEVGFTWVKAPVPGDRAGERCIESHVVSSLSAGGPLGARETDEATGPLEAVRSSLVGDAGEFGGHSGSAGSPEHRAALHQPLIDLAQRIFDKHGVRVQSAAFDWLDGAQRLLCTASHLSSSANATERGSL